jgi:hypothetical protein
VAVRKKRPVLYEVYRPRVKTAEPVRKPHPPSAPWDADQASATSERGAETPAKPAVSFAPTTSTAPDRWHVTVSAPTLTIASAAVVVLLAVAFAGGRRYEFLHPSMTEGAELAGGGSDETGAGTQDTAVATIETSGADQASGTTTPPGQSAGAADRAARERSGDMPPQITLRRGYHYVIIQHFGGKRDDALATAEFLQNNDVPCAVLPGRDIRLVATQPFLIDQGDRAAAEREQQAADRLIQKIKEIGKRFAEHRQGQGKGSYTLDKAYLYHVR